jgi:hypothetical protein
MLQLVILALVVLVLYFASDIIKKLFSAKNSAGPGKKGEEVLDISNAWIDLGNLPYQSRKRFLNDSEKNLLTLLQELVTPKLRWSFPKFAWLKSSN